MTTSILRTYEGWWVEDPKSSRALKIATKASTTAELLADAPAVADASARLASGTTTAVAELALLSPVTTPNRVAAQMVNYRTHAKDSGFDPDTVPPTFFRKASSSVTGPYDAIERPAHVRLLDYEIELGLVIGRHIALGTAIGDGDLSRYVAGLVVTNDVSARDVQLRQGQFYESKSYPTFTPIGPRLVLLEPNEFAQLDRLRLTLSVNHVIRQDRTVSDMIVRPSRALTLLARFQQLDPGDILLTGTPGGTALKAPAKVVELLGGLLPTEKKWDVFFRRQAQNTRYLQNGDVITARIATDDGAVDLGEQRNRVEYK